MDVDHRMLFIGGLHRSGTSLLHESLRTSPDVSGFAGTGAYEDEGQHLQSVIPTGRQHGGPGRFAFNPEAHLTETSPLATPECARQLVGQWAPYWDAASPWWIEKSPPNLLRSRLLQAMFPQAAFVMVMRHPVEAALATRRRWPGSPWLHRQLAHWFRAYRLMDRDLPHLRHVRIVRYEDFVRDPGRVLADLAGFLGVADQFTRPAVDPSASARYAEVWRAMRRSPRTAVYARLLELQYARRARAYGYAMRLGG